MYRKLLIVLLGGAAVLATGSLLVLRERTNSRRTAASIGLGLRTPTPMPTPTPGTLALTDVNDLIKLVPPSAPVGPVLILEGGLKVQDIVVGTGAEREPEVSALVWVSIGEADSIHLESLGES